MPVVNTTQSFPSCAYFCAARTAWTTSADACLYLSGDKDTIPLRLRASAAPRSKSVAVLAELRIEDRRQHLQQHLLNEPILYRRDAQHSRASARLGYFYLPALGRRGTQTLSPDKQRDASALVVKGSERRFPPTASPGSFPGAPEDVSPVSPSSSGRSPPPLCCVLPPPKPARSSRPLPPLPSGSRTLLSFGRFAPRHLKSIAFGSPRFHRFCLRSSQERHPLLTLSPTRVSLDRSSPLFSSVPQFFSPSLQPHYRPSSLLRLLLTSSTCQRRCKNPHSAV